MNYTDDMGADISVLQDAIGYTFKDKELLEAALSHSSCSCRENYERLEFLGDAVIELCVSNVLYTKHPKAGEGELTKRRAAIVCSDALVEAAKRIKLGRFMRLGKGETLSGGREKKSILENAFESLLGAIYLDSGLDEVQKITEKLLIETTPAAEQAEVLNGDYKSQLQEMLQALGTSDIVYLTYQTKGPPHDTIFYVRLYIGGSAISEGSGKSKKQAEQDAAKNAINILK